MTDRYIVGVTSLMGALNVFSERNIKVERLFPFISAVGISALPQTMTRISRLPTVRSVHADYLVRTSEKERGTAVFSRGETPEESGRGAVTVAVIDTGVDEHPDLVLFPNRIAVFVDFVSGRKTAYDDNGHGTAVTGVICGSRLCRGEYPKRSSRHIRIAALKALTASGEGTAFDILSAMQWVYSNRDAYRIRVVNMSLGALPAGGDPLRLGADALVRAGVCVVASAGNGAETGEGVLSPATSPYVIAVGGLSENRRAAFSPIGQGKPDIYAPAVNVDTLSPFGGYTSMTGTSLAAPRVSAAAAELLYRYPTYTPERVKSYLRSSSKKGEDGINILNDEPPS